MLEEGFDILMRCLGEEEYLVVSSMSLPETEVAAFTGSSWHIDGSSVAFGGEDAESTRGGLKEPLLVDSTVEIVLDYLSTVFILSPSQVQSHSIFFTNDVGFVFSSMDETKVLMFSSILLPLANVPVRLHQEPFHLLCCGSSRLGR